MTKLGFLRLSYEKQDTLLKLLILSMAAVLSFSTRLFSVLRFESVIHEFDPYFNYRTTRFLAEEGFYKFHNWFDDRAWYPLGRIIGGTIYPGLMVTSAVLYHVLHFFHITIDIRNVCVFLAPLFSSFTAIVTYHLTKELKVHLFFSVGRWAVGRQETGVDREERGRHAANVAEAGTQTQDHACRTKASVHRPRA
ncbi:Dolichyl-diphosphooligosaccharide--protein glycosyltransferase subunit stt3a [Ameca splendens]|uniref:Dolichyl-diphosphooligosaccharide--protein glycosyltransferase subunit STT3A n=1 Tax=Ameca splendens TaxID=208324 RepID=A0ABV0YNM5_9TELE